MSAESALHSTIGPLLLSADGLDEGEMLLLHLLHEARNRSSPYRPHLCTLPRIVPLPAFMRPAQLVEVARASGSEIATLHERVLRIRRDMASQHARIAPLLRQHPETFPSSGFSPASLAWGAAILRSRTWRAPPAAAIANSTHAAVANGSAAAAPPAWRAAGMRMLVPVADMANHDGARGKPALLRRPAAGGGGGGGDVVLWTAARLRAGEELTISYGDKCPLDLLVNYGFIPPAGAAASPACADPATSADVAEGMEAAAGGGGGVAAAAVPAATAAG
jgi:hypothetical protein